MSAQLKEIVFYSHSIPLQHFSPNRGKRFLRRCRANGIEPILLSVPLSSAHRAQYTPEIESAFQGHVAAIAQKYSCRYCDYRTAVPDRLFIDHHHAGPEGAAMFSRQFAREVLAPAWRGNGP